MNAVRNECNEMSEKVREGDSQVKWDEGASEWGIYLVKVSFS